jgi:ornithine cyclodeaminase/alanine dehydrogenase-like protein (mu-crystallin family)
MIQITNEQMETILSYERLIPCLKEAFTKDYNLPKRHHHQYPNPKEGNESTLLLMPAWDDGKNMGVKIVNVTPDNAKYDLPTIQGLYLLFDLPTGSPKAQMDAKLLTAKRTAATSALASSFLSKKDSDSMLMIGTGTLCKELIHAHLTVRSLKHIYIWGRNYQKATAVADSLEIEGVSISAIDSIDEKISSVDIVSCATLSPTALVLGSYIKPGQHYDMIGAYKPDMREADDRFISSVDIFVDSYEGASKETGDLAIPLAEETITMEDLKASLFELCRNLKAGREKEEQITCFKSVGHSLEDLAAASLVYNEIIN